MDSFVETYRNEFPSYQAFANRLEALLVDLLKADGIKVHFTESRAKSPASFSEKIKRPGKSYKNPLKEVPDLSGVRVVLYYQDDSSKLRDLILREFSIVDVENSHQPDNFSPDQFGYISTHYLVKLNAARIKLPEWKKYKKYHAEIQVRTVLQHSWAAVSHALQYKREGDVPLALRRKLYRLASLFELADEQFVDIKNQSERLRSEASEEVQINNQEAVADALVVEEFLNSSPEMEKIMVSLGQLGFNVEEFSSDLHPLDDDDYIGRCVEILEQFDVANLGFLNRLVKKNHHTFFTNIASSGWMVSRDFILYLMILYEFSGEISVGYLVDHGWAEDIAQRVVKGFPD